MHKWLMFWQNKTRQELVSIIIYYTYIHYNWEWRHLGWVRSRQRGFIEVWIDKKRSSRVGQFPVLRHHCHKADAITVDIALIIWLFLGHRLITPVDPEQFRTLTSQIQWTNFASGTVSALLSSGCIISYVVVKDKSTIFKLHVFGQSAFDSV